MGAEVARVLALVATAQEREALIITGFAARAGLSFAETQTLFTGYETPSQDLKNIIAFQDRIKLEANTV